MSTFQKFFKNGGHFEFSNFYQNWKRKICAISLTVRDRVISSKFSTPRVSKKYTKPTFQKNFKNGGHFEFSNFRQKCKIYAISLTVRERFRRNFRPPGCLRNILSPLFKTFLKMAAILNFRIFTKNAKTQNICYLLNHER